MAGPQLVTHRERLPARLSRSDLDEAASYEGAPVKGRLRRGEDQEPVAERGISSLPLVTYFLPGLAGGLWILLLVVTWRWI